MPDLYHPPQDPENPTSNLKAATCRVGRQSSKASYKVASGPKYLSGVLLIRGSCYSGIYIWAPDFRKHPYRSLRESLNPCPVATPMSHGSRLGAQANIGSSSIRHEGLGLRVQGSGFRVYGVLLPMVSLNHETLNSKKVDPKP